MVVVTISPAVTPAVYQVLTVCMATAVEAAESGARAMGILEDSQHQAAYEQASAILAAIHRQFEREANPGHIPLH